MSAPTQGISRRRVLMGAAWTAPAILVATAVPAAAASTSPQLGSLVFTTNTVKRATVDIYDQNWAQKPILVIDPDIANAAIPGGPSVTGTTLTFTIPKAWLPNGTLGWHGFRADLPGGGTPADFVVTFAQSANAYTFFLQTVTVLGPNYQTTFSPEYRIEVSPSVNLAGQQLVLRAAGSAGVEAWGTNSTATIA